MIKDLDNKQLVQLGTKNNLIDKSKKYTRNDLINLLEEYKKLGQKRDHNINWYMRQLEIRYPVLKIKMMSPPKPSNSLRLQNQIPMERSMLFKHMNE